MEYRYPNGLGRDLQSVTRCVCSRGMDAGAERLHGQRILGWDVVTGLFGITADLGAVVISFVMLRFRLVPAAMI
jgi:hypothetical protein